MRSTAIKIRLSPVKQSRPANVTALLKWLLEEAIWRTLTDAFTNPRTLRRLVEENLQALQASGNQERIQVLSKQLAGLRAKERRVMDLMIELEDARDELRQRLQSIRLERRRVEAQLQQLDHAGAREAASVLDSVDAFTADIRGAGEQLDVGGRAEFVRRSVERITWDGEVAEIRCFFTAVNSADQPDDVAGFSRLYLTLKARLAA